LQQDAPEPCEEIVTFNIFYSIDFFLIYMIAIIFMTAAVQIFTVFPERIHRSHESIEAPKKRTHAYSGKIPF